MESNKVIQEVDGFDSDNVACTNTSKLLKQLIERLESGLLDSQDAKRADASVLIAITHEANPKLLLTRRASHMNSHAGEVSFAGGMYEEADVSNQATALREAEEETGLIVDSVEVIGALAPQLSKSGLTVQPIVGLIPADVLLQAEPNEIARIFWVDLDWLISAPTTDYQVAIKFGDEDVILNTPSWQVHDEVIWGLTGRIIADMLDVVFDKKIDWYYEPIS